MQSWRPGFGMGVRDDCDRGKSGGNKRRRWPHDPPAMVLHHPQFQVYELNKGNLKLVHERETDAGIKCCTFGASSLEDRHLVGFSSAPVELSDNYLTRPGGVEV